MVPHNKLNSLRKAQAVMSETQDIVIAGGVEVMSQVPIGAAIVDSFKAGHGQPYGGKGTSERYRCSV